jgi:hypothetical protein
MKIEKDGRTYVQCEMCERFATFDNAVKLGWDWFTGYLSSTRHYCPQHKGSPERNEMFARSRDKAACPNTAKDPTR